MTLTARDNSVIYPGENRQERYTSVSFLQNIQPESLTSGNTAFANQECQDNYARRPATCLCVVEMSPYSHKTASSPKTTIFLYAGVESSIDYTLAL